MEIRFDLFQKFEGVGDALVCVVAGLVVAQGGLGPVAGVVQAASVS